MFGYRYVHSDQHAHVPRAFVKSNERGLSARIRLDCYTVGGNGQLVYVGFRATMPIHDASFVPLGHASSKIQSTFGDIFCVRSWVVVCVSVFLVLSMVFDLGEPSPLRYRGRIWEPVDRPVAARRPGCEAAVV